MSRERFRRALAAAPLALALDASAAGPSEADFVVESFDAIRFAGAATLIIRQGPEPRLRARGNEERLARLEVEVEGGRLDIRDRGVKRGHRNGELTLEIVTPALTSLATAGEAQVRADELSGATLAIDARGDADYRMPDVSFETLELRLRGDTDVEIGGRATTTLLSAFGDARYEGSDLQADSVEIDIRGDADVAVHAVERLDVSIYGDGRIRYHGRPEVSQRIFGDGIITSLD